MNQHHTGKVKASFVLFDEIEKAPDASWNLLPGILDKATLTRGDNRRVDFSHAMIFMTSNPGAGEMGNLLCPGLGFGVFQPENGNVLDERVASKISRAGMNAVRRKFTPEFINRLDKIVVFKPRGQAELRRILEIEGRPSRTGRGAASPRGGLPVSIRVPAPVRQGVEAGPVRIHHRVAHVHVRLVAAILLRHHLRD